MILNPYAIVIDVYATLGGKQPGATSYADHKAYINANGQAAYLTALEGMFATQTNATMSATILANLGLASIFTAAQGEAYLAANAGNRVKAALDLASALTNYVSDATNTNNAAILAAKTTYVATTANAYTYASNAANTADAATSSAAVSTGQTFTLTTGADILNTVAATAANKTTAYDDTIYGIADGTLTSSDVIDGGAGNDTVNAGATAAGQTIAPVLTGVETVTITHTAADGKAFTFSAANATGLTLANIKNGGAVSDNAGDEKITVSNLAKTTTLGIVGGIASAAATGAVLEATWTGAAAADTQKIAIGAAGKATSLTLVTAETVEITATGTGTTGASTLGTLGAGAAKTLNIKGSGDLTISASNLAGTSTAAVAVNASEATGVISFAGESGSKHVFTGGSGNTTVTLAGTADDSVTTGAGRDTITTGAGNDTVVAGAGDDKVIVGAQTDVTALDSIDGGVGFDTIVVTGATLNATTKTELAKGSKGFEAVETTAATLATIDFQALSAYDTAKVSAAMAAAYNGTADKAGTNSITATTENSDVLIISAARAGMSAGKDANTKSTLTGAATAGGDGINITPYLDNGSNVATVKFIGNADINGGAGEVGLGTAAGDIGGTGGDALDAASTEVLNIAIVGTQATTADTVTFTAGAGGATGGKGAGVNGSTVIVGTNATINLTSELDPLTATAAKHNHIELGTVKGTNVTINGAAFLGNITVTAADGNVTINTGAGADTVVGGAGSDTFSTGAGVDSVQNRASGAAVTAGDSITLGAGFDTVTLIGSAASAANYNAAPNVTDFQVGDRADNTDLIKLSTGNSDYSGGLSVDGTGAGASGDIGVFTLAQNATYDSGTSTTNEFLKLTTGVAFTTSLQATFNAAIGTGSVTNLTTGVYAGSFYDTTNSKMVILEVTSNGTSIETADVVRLIGTIDMSAADYALIDTDNFASML